MTDLKPILSNPTLGYRLDPYEPGLLRRAKANQSTIQVVGHEHRNLTRLTRQAVEEGRVIVRKQITYRPTIAGSYMGVAAGKTTVVSMEKIKPEDEDAIQKPEDKDQENNPSDIVSIDGEGIPTSMQPELAQISVEELAKEEQDLRAEIRSISNEIEGLERKGARSSDEAVPLQEDEDPGKLKFELEQKKQELRNVTLAKISKTQAELMATVNQGVVNSYQAAMNIIKLANNAGGDPVGQNFDTFV